MERGLQDAFFSPLQVLERGPGGEVSESPVFVIIYLLLLLCVSLLLYEFISKRKPT